MTAARTPCAPPRSPPAPASAELEVLLTNHVTLNTGDAAILLGTMRVLRDAFDVPLRFVVRDRQPEVARRLYPELTFLGRPQLTAWHRRGALPSDAFTGCATGSACGLCVPAYPERAS